MNKISLATFLAHPRRAYCSYLGKELGETNNTHSQITTTKLLKRELERELQILIKEKPSLSAAKGIELARDKLFYLHNRGFSHTDMYGNTWMHEEIDMPADVELWRQGGELTAEEGQIIERALRFFTLPIYEETTSELMSNSISQNHLS